MFGIATVFTKIASVFCFNIQRFDNFFPSIYAAEI